MASRKPTRCHRHLEMRAFFSCMAWSPIPSPLPKLHRRLDSLYYTHWAPRDTHRNSRRERNSLLTLELRTDSPDESGMQTRDPCRPWRATLDPGHKPRLGLFCPAVTLVQSPAPPRNPNGRLDFKANKRKPKFPVITRESRRILSKTTWFSRHRKMRPLPATAFQKMSQVPS